MSLAPANYDFGKSSNYSFATTVTCANEASFAQVTVVANEQLDDFPKS